MRLSKYLRLNGIKINFFAKKLGVHRTTLYRYIIGVYKTPLTITLAVKHLTNGKVSIVQDKIQKKEEEVLYFK